MSEVTVNAALVKQLDAEIASDLTACTVGLFINNVDPGPETVLADLTPATFAGYAPKVVAAWVAAFLARDGVAETTGGILTWTVGVGGGTDSVYGYFIRSVDAGTPLRSIVKFDTPVPMQTLGQTLSLAMRTQNPAGEGGIVL